MDFTGAAAIFVTLLVLFFGLCVGSFLNVVIYRLPREGLSVAQPRRSFCPACLNLITWQDNIPVISWLRLKGRCRHCRQPISLRYPLIEILAAFLSLFIFQAEGLTFRYFFYFYFSMCLTAIAFIDLELMIIPNVLIWPTEILGLLIAAVTPHPPLAGLHLWHFLADHGFSERFISVAGALAAYAVGYLALWLVAFLYKAIKGHRGLGEGDPPLLGLICIYLGLPSILPVLLMSSVLALLTVGCLVFTGRFERQNLGVKAIPFGPFLALAALIFLFAGQDFLSWYFSLFPQSNPILVY
ncbi:MAG: prepilin peptidase [Deltaproteobacteria bacterium]|jgi:leader peptidase (prepilin peptidase)/N-methyltransferase|nr:prepilin peptidase [Deltaproteobacteria bacterium]